MSQERQKRDRGTQAIGPGANGKMLGEQDGPFYRRDTGESPPNTASNCL
jgi:hypothetical protein